MEDRRIFAVDMRNHGSSSHHDSMTYEEMAEDVLAFMVDQVDSKVSRLSFCVYMCLMQACLSANTGSNGCELTDIATVKSTPT